jgi:hypothetical protein
MACLDAHLYEIEYRRKETIEFKKYMQRKIIRTIRLSNKTKLKIWYKREDCQEDVLLQNKKWIRIKWFNGRLHRRSLFLNQA